jgi:hypothetical protein
VAVDAQQQQVTMMTGPGQADDRLLASPKVQRLVKTYTAFIGELRNLDATLGAFCRRRCWVSEIVIDDSE